MRYLLLLLFLPVISFGQIVISANDFSDGGDTVRVSSTQDPSIDFTTTGPDQTWDFSSLVATSQELKDYDDLSSMPLVVNIIFGGFAAPQYQASNAVTSTDIPIEQMTQILPITIEELRQFSKNTADSITSLGFSMLVEGNELPVKSDTIEKRYEFPLMYGNTYSSRGYTNMDMNPIYNAIWIQYRQRNSEVDGWGSITTPYGTFDALRVKHSITETDSLFMDIFGAMWIELPIPDSYIYEWLAVGELEPVMRITTNDIFGTETVTNIEYKDVYLGLDVGIDENEISFEIFPNPAVETIQIRGIDHPHTYTIYSMSGIVMSNGAINGQEQINIGDLSAGNYVIHLTDGFKNSFSKFVKD